MMIEMLAIMEWDPGFRGLLTVALSVVILCGAVALILGTNSGARLGFLIALSGLFGWFVVMGVVWSAYGIGPQGPTPTWELVEAVAGDPDQSRIDVARELPLPDELPDPVALRDNDDQFADAFPVTGRDPNLGDLVSLDEGLRDAVNEEAGSWEIIETSDGQTGETQSAVAELIGSDGLGLFDGPTDYVVHESYLTGGKSRRTDDSTIGRIIYRVRSAVEFTSPPFYAAVQVQAVVPQETRAGQAPPLPVADEDAPIYTVILERDRGSQRLPAMAFTGASAIVFLITCSSLHRRDKLATEQRAAVTPAGAA